MPATNYYNDFLVAERDADGIVTPLTGETLDIYLASDDSLLGDVTTDDYGQIYGAGFSLAEGTLIYFQHSSLTRFYQTLYETIEIAETKNLIPVFIAVDANTNTTEAKIVEIWMENLDEPAEPRIKAGEIDLRLGTSLKIPSESFYPKNYKFTALAKTDGGTYATTDFHVAESANFAADSASANDTTLINNFLPSQSGNANESLVTDGTNVSWQPRVSSVGLSLPSIFSVTGSPVTSSGTIAASLASQLQNLVFASPNGSSGTPTFRALVSADIPTLDAAKIGTGTFADARIPNLAASKITSGVFTPARVLSSVNNNSVGYVDGSGNLTTGANLTFNGTSLGVGNGLAAYSRVRALEAITSSGDYQLRLGNNGASFANFDIGRNNSINGYLYFYGNQSSADGYVFDGVGGEKMRILPSGLVGIGGTPTSKFQVSYTNTSSTLALTGAHFGLENPDTSTGQTNFVFSFGGTAKGGVRADFAGNFNWHSVGYHQFYTSIGITTPIMNISSSGVFIGGSAGVAGTAVLDINSDILRLRTAKTPATSGAAGNTGDICWDSNYFYVCVASNTWKRAALSTW